MKLLITCDTLGRQIISQKPAKIEHSSITVTDGSSDTMYFKILIYKAKIVTLLGLEFGKQFSTMSQQTDKDFK